MRNHSTTRTDGVDPLGPPRRNPQFAHLPLDGLRSYRQTLTTEENRVSYWRRLVQARLDLVRTVQAGFSPSVEELGQIYAGDRGVARGAHMELLPLDDLPPLPDLAKLWLREPVPGNPAHNAALAHDLHRAEKQLSAYRAALHRRLAVATQELIARYREQPSLCLSVLPVQPASRAELG